MDRGANRVCKVNKDFRWGAAMVVLAIVFAILYTAMDLILKVISYV